MFYQLPRNHPFMIVEFMISSRITILYIFNGSKMNFLRDAANVCFSPSIMPYIRKH